MTVVPLIDTRSAAPIDDQNDDTAAALNVIGAVLYQPSAMDHAEGLEPRHFSDPCLGRLWAVLQSTAAEGENADIVVVTDRLRADPWFEGFGGARVLADLVDKANAYPPAIVSHAGLIIELHQRREVSTLAAEAMVALSSGSSAASVIGDLDGALLALRTKDKRPLLVSAATASKGVLAYLDATEDDAGGTVTGLDPLDDGLGRLLPDDLILIAGRPGAGKSALAACISLNVAKAGVGVIEINSEMSVAQMMRRHLTDLCHERWGGDAPTYRDIRRRTVTARQREMIQWAASEISPLPLFMAKRTGLTLSALRSMVRRQAAIWAGQGVELGLITVDHVGLLASDERGRGRYEDQTTIAIGLKALADDLHVPLIALVQLSRKVEDRENKRPILPDMRDSGAWEENADVVIGVYREAYYAKSQNEPKEATGRGKADAELAWAEWDRARKSKTIEAILLKVREGEEATIKLWSSIGHNAIRGAAPYDGGF